nr:MAG TPA: hypothetical protein [Caudoviricetes sp.]
MIHQKLLKKPEKHSERLPQAREGHSSSSLLLL